METFLKEYPNFVGRYRDADKMYNLLESLLIDAGMTQSVQALGYMKKRHAGQTRDNGLPYIVHPMSMALRAISRISDSNITDELIATLLLHDVCEDCKVLVGELPFSSIIRESVNYMSLIPFDSETKLELKKRFYHQLPENKNASLGKGYDRYDNLRTLGDIMNNGVLEEETLNRIRKNVTETDRLLLPALKQAERGWKEASVLLRSLRSEIQAINDRYAIYYKVKLMDEDFVNVPDAVDYYYLLSKEKVV